MNAIQKQREEEYKKELEKSSKMKAKESQILPKTEISSKE